MRIVTFGLSVCQKGHVSRLSEITYSVMWIVYIGLTIITLSGYNFSYLYLICGYLSFIPLSGVSQVLLGKRIRLRSFYHLSVPRLGESKIHLSLRIGRGVQILHFDFYSLIFSEKRPGSVGAVPIPFSLILTSKTFLSYTDIV